MNPVTLDGLPIGECTSDPERWFAAADEGAKAICRICPRRWACARDAVELPYAEGLWAGIVIPEEGRQRGHALRQLRGLAESNGYPVRRRPALREAVSATASPTQADSGSHVDEVARRNTPNQIHGYTEPTVLTQYAMAPR
jgi:WhiB family transcriptional regulator, redox-sensing transcriptional regulator